MTFKNDSFFSVQSLNAMTLQTLMSEFEFKDVQTNRLLARKILTDIDPCIQITIRGLGDGTIQTWVEQRSNSSSDDWKMLKYFDNTKNPAEVRKLVNAYYDELRTGKQNMSL